MLCDPNSQSCFLFQSDSVFTAYNVSGELLTEGENIYQRISNIIFIGLSVTQKVEEDLLSRQLCKIYVLNEVTETLRSQI